MGVVIFSQPEQQFGDVIARVEADQVPLLRMKSGDKFGFGEEIEARCVLAEEHYLTRREQVKSGFKRSLEPPPPLGQGRNLAEFPREQHDDAAGLTEVGHAQNQSFRLLSRHASQSR